MTNGAPIWSPVNYFVNVRMVVRLHYGSGYMRIKMGGFSTSFLGKGDLIGHSGSTGSFAFYYPNKELFFVGDFNQMKYPALPIRFVMQLAMFAP